MIELFALKIFPWALLTLSLAIACFIRWRQFPALATLAALNVARGVLYLAGFYAWNPSLSRVSALLILIASEEAIRRAGIRPWPTVFCAGVGLMVGSLAAGIGNAAEPLKSGAHVAALSAMAVAWIVSILRFSPAKNATRLALMVLYSTGAAVSSKQNNADAWWSIITTETMHLAALSGLLWLALQAQHSTAPEPAL